MDTEIRNHENEIRILSEKLSQIEKAYDMEIISLSQFENMKTELSNKIAQLKAEIDMLSANQTNIEDELTDEEKKKLAFLEELLSLGILTSEDFTTKKAALLQKFTEVHQVAENEEVRDVVKELFEQLNQQDTSEEVNNNVEEYAAEEAEGQQAEEIVSEMTDAMDIFTITDDEDEIEEVVEEEQPVEDTTLQENTDTVEEAIVTEEQPEEVLSVVEEVIDTTETEVEEEITRETVEEVEEVNEITETEEEITEEAHQAVEETKQEELEEEKPAKKEKKKPSLLNRIFNGLVSTLLILILIGMGVGTFYVVGGTDFLTYNKALSEYKKGNYEEALLNFEKVATREGVDSYIRKCNSGIAAKKQGEAITLYNEGKYDEALAIFESITETVDCKGYINLCVTNLAESTFKKAVEKVQNLDVLGALTDMNRIGSDYLSADNKKLLAQYNDSLCDEILKKAGELIVDGNKDGALEILRMISNYPTVSDLIKKLESGSKYVLPVYNLGENADLSNGKGDRVYILVAGHNIRVTTNTASNKVGTCNQYYSYPIYSTKTIGNSVWYEIGENQWIITKEGTWTKKY